MEQEEWEAIERAEREGGEREKGSKRRKRRVQRKCVGERGKCVGREGGERGGRKIKAYYLVSIN